MNKTNKDNNFTVDSFLKIFPKSIHKTITDEFVDKMNNIVDDEELRKVYYEQVITYAVVINDGRYKLIDYMNATKYTMHKMMGDNNLESYIKTFPDRHKRMIKAGKTEKDISSFVSIYNGNALVNAIMEKALIPAYIFGQDLNARAMAKVLELMDGANSEMVQLKAAQEILERTSIPQEYKIKTDVTINDGSSIIDEYLNAFNKIAEKQITTIKGGSDISKIANFKIKEEIIDV